MIYLILLVAGLVGLVGMALVGFAHVPGGHGHAHGHSLDFNLQGGHGAGTHGAGALPHGHAPTALPGPAPGPALASIRVPTLVLVGETDAITPPQGAEAMAKKIPGAKYEVIRGAGHMAPMEQPEQVNRAMLSFLKSIQS